MTNVSKFGVKLFDSIRYESAAGRIRGEVVSMRLGLNAANELVPWITIEHIVNNREVRTEICGTEQNLTMLKFMVLFSDKSLHAA